MRATVHRLRPRRRPRRALAGLGIAAAVLLTACGGSSDSGSAQGGGTSTTSVTVGVIPIIDVAPIYLGIQQGFFKEQGLDVKLETAQGGAAIIPAVVSGQYQFGFSNTISLLVAESKGVPIKAVAAGVSSTGKDGADFGAVVVPKDSPIKTAADLAGKRVAVNTLNNINTTTINKAVRDAGADPSTINYTELAFPDIAAAVAKGDVDAGQVVEPFLTIAKGQGMREVSSNYAATDPDLSVGMYFTSTNYTQQNSTVVDQFVTAMRKSLDYAQSNSDAARTILSTYTKIDPSVQKDVTLPRWSSDISRDSVTLLADLATQDKLIPAPPDLATLLP